MVILKGAIRTLHLPWHWQNMFRRSEVRKRLKGMPKMCEATLPFLSNIPL